MSDKPTPEEIQWLQEIRNGQLLGRGSTMEVTTAIRDRLITLGLIEQKLGGLVITAKGSGLVS
jgi:hypothetical protein